MTESRLREEMVEFGALLTGLGLAHGSTGNISVRLDDGWLITPTNSRMGRLDPARIGCTAAAAAVSGDGSVLRAAGAAGRGHIEPGDGAAGP
jgi:ribulose-5-phosphate 4-epimerase/fuculose-1-phosphate aldolase